MEPRLTLFTSVESYAPQLNSMYLFPITQYSLPVDSRSGDVVYSPMLPQRVLRAHDHESQSNGACLNIPGAPSDITACHPIVIASVHLEVLTSMQYYDDVTYPIIIVLRCGQVLEFIIQFGFHTLSVFSCPFLNISRLWNCGT